MKYIVISAANKSGEHRFPFIFPNNLVHSHVAKVMTLLVSLMFPTRDVTVTSAGEINAIEFSGECFGKSTTLGLESKPVEDTQLVRMNDYGAGSMNA
ncbi:hypothetical protein UFOVP1254_84 [uncultured Caudovirales phage]|uniref:Uncharacterized protein n=1 Tax=uncultured Caudovirales phage TaxID=2100421 RepID=A0A6J5RJW8_9CAUD|nr:hypothetical protein UFOVP1254_84 [uncultured Caudovirales phage]